jgi:2-amino-4-hydroxy-6-hydroxymethyldihydropteridine diphosphokinase
MGRIRAQKWGPRNIDLDVLVHRDGPVAEDDLVIPHPRISERAFVLAPLADVDPYLVLNGKTVAAWLAEIDTTGVEPFPGSMIMRADTSA